jgi:hypothetical protein
VRLVVDWRKMLSLMSICGLMVDGQLPLNHRSSVVRSGELWAVISILEES